MFAKNLETVLARLLETADTSHSLPEEFAARFDALRRYGLLPRGRINREQRLTESEIAAAILGVVTPKPSWAGHTALILGNLRSVGGTDGAFFGTSTLQEAIANIIGNPLACETVIRLEVSAAESGRNSAGHATLSFTIGPVRRRAIYVPQLAISLLGEQPSDDMEYRLLYSPFSRNVSFFCD